MSVKYWVLSGNEENWATAFEGSMWGVREGRLMELWENISNGDILFFYCLSPIGGIIGFGKCQAKFKQDKPLWPDEIKEGKLIYPYRWQFETIYVLPKSEWKNRCIPLGGEIKLAFRAGLNPVANKISVNLLNQKIREHWKVDVIEEPISEFLKGAADKKTLNQHERIKDLLLNLGKINKFLVEDEYRMDGQRLDVIWKRVEKGVPAFVFEVQVGGNITEALAKLKHAFDLWSSNLYLAIDDQDRSKVESLLSGTFHEIRDRVTIIPVSEIEEFYNLKVSEAKMKEKFKLP